MANLGSISDSSHRSFVLLSMLLQPLLALLVALAVALVLFGRIEFTVMGSVDSTASSHLELVLVPSVLVLVRMLVLVALALISTLMLLIPLGVMPVLLFLRPVVEIAGAGISRSKRAATSLC